MTHDELLAHHHAVLYAVGAPNDRRLDIDGMGLPGTGTATEVVAWFNGHPEFADLPVDLGQNGLSSSATATSRSTSAASWRPTRTRWRARISPTTRWPRCGIAGTGSGHRRPPRPGAQSAFTLPELIGLTSTCEVMLDPADHERVLATWPGRRTGAPPRKLGDHPLRRNKLEILSKLGDAGSHGLAPATRPRIRLAYQLTPNALLGTGASTVCRSPRLEPTSCVSSRAGWCRPQLGTAASRFVDCPSRSRRRWCRTTAAVCSTLQRVYRCGQLCRRLDQTRPDRFHRSQQVVCGADRAQPGRRLQPRPAGRRRGQACGTGQTGAQPPTRGGRRGRLEGDHAAEFARGGEDRPCDKFTASPTCSPPPRRRPRHQCAATAGGFASITSDRPPRYRLSRESAEIRHKPYFRRSPDQCFEANATGPV